MKKTGKASIDKWDNSLLIGICNADVEFLFLFLYLGQCGCTNLNAMFLP